MKEYRVHGAPGCGKTTWIERKASVCAKLFMGDQVSICSLTNAAVREVASREILIPEQNLTTLHARCKRALSAGAPAESFAKDFVSEHPSWKISMSREGYSGQLNLYERSQILRQQMVPKDAWASDVRKFHEAWSGWCQDTGRMDFTGWLEAALKESPLPPQQVVFIDEAQDHTPLQLAVIKAWPTQRLILVGDADQSIYEWSGAIPDEFAKKPGEGIKETILEQSYRVPRAVHATATQFIRHVKGREERAYLPRDADGSSSIIDYNLDEARSIERLPDGLLKNEDETYMIITSCAYMLDPIIELLIRKRIPFHNPYRKENAAWNPLREPTRFINSFLIKDRMWSGHEAKVWGDRISSKTGFKSRKKKRFLAMCDELGRMPLKPEDITNHFNEAYSEAILARDFKVVKEIGRRLKWDYALDVYKNGNESPRLVVGTIHSVKGGESDNVILFPDLSKSGIMAYLGAGVDGIHRLFYVGMTRARKNLYLCSRSRASGAISWT